MNRQRRWLELIQEGRQRSALQSGPDKVRTHDGNSDPCARCVTGRLGIADNEPRMHRNGNVRLVSDECPNIRRH